MEPYEDDQRGPGPPQRASQEFSVLNSNLRTGVSEILDEDDYVPIQIPSGQEVIDAADAAMREIIKLRGLSIIEAEAAAKEQPVVSKAAEVEKVPEEVPKQLVQVPIEAVQVVKPQVVDIPQQIPVKKAEDDMQLSQSLNLDQSIQVTKELIEEHKEEHAVKLEQQKPIEAAGKDLFEIQGWNDRKESHEQPHEAAEEKAPNDIEKDERLKQDEPYPAQLTEKIKAEDTPVKLGEQQTNEILQGPAQSIQKQERPVSPETHPETHPETRPEIRPEQIPISQSIPQPQVHIEPAVPSQQTPKQVHQVNRDNLISAHIDTEAKQQEVLDQRIVVQVIEPKKSPAVQVPFEGAQQMSPEANATSSKPVVNPIIRPPSAQIPVKIRVGKQYLEPANIPIAKPTIPTQASRLAEQECQRKEEAERRKKAATIKERIQHLQNIQAIIAKIKKAVSRAEKNQAIELVDSLPEAYKSKTTVMHIKAKLLNGVDRRKEALELYDVLTRSQPNNSTFALERACIELAEGNEKAVRQSIKPVDLQNADRYVIFGDLEYAKKSTPEQCLKFYKKAYGLKQTGVTASRLAACYLNNQKWAEALQYLTVATDKSRQCAQYQNDRGYAEMKLQKFPEASKSLDIAVSFDQTPWQFRNNQELCRHQLRKSSEDTIRSLEQAARASRKDMRVVLNLAVMTGDLKGAAAAVRVYEQYLEDFKTNIEYWLSYCNAVLQTRDVTLIRKTASNFMLVYNLNLDKKPFRIIFCKLCAAYDSKSNIAHCQSLITRLLDPKESDQNMRMQMMNTSALISKNANDLERAISELKTAISLGYNHPVLRINLAYCQCLHGKFGDVFKTLQPLNHILEDLPREASEKVAMLTMTACFGLPKIDVATKYIQVLLNQKRSTLEKGFIDKLKEKLDRIKQS